MRTGEKGIYPVVKREPGNYGKGKEEEGSLGQRDRKGKVESREKRPSKKILRRENQKKGRQKGSSV